jgi:hypothetical protein
LAWPALPIVPEIEETLISLRKTSLPSPALGLGRLAPVRGERPGDAEGHDGVDVEHRLELLVGHPVDDAVPGVAGVVDDDVDAPKASTAAATSSVGRLRLGQVAGVDRGLAVDLRRPPARRRRRRGR